MLTITFLWKLRKQDHWIVASHPDFKALAPYGNHN